MQTRIGVGVVLGLVLLTQGAWAATYYAATNGSGSANCNSPGTACTLDRGLDFLGSGDTLIVRCGTYFQKIANQIPSGATVQAETGGFCVELRPSGSGHTDDGIAINGFSDIVVDGININCESTRCHDGVTINDSTNITIRNARITGAYNQGMSPSGNTILLENLTVDNAGLSCKDGSQDIDHCHGIYMHGDNIRGTYLDLYENETYGLHSTGDSGPCTNCVWDRIRMHHQQGGFSNHGNHIIKNSLIYNNSVRGGFPSSDQILHNSIYNNGGIGLQANFQSTRTIRNNILRNNGENFVESDNGFGSTTFSENMCNSSSDAFCQRGGDPGWLNPDAGDFQLPSGSSPAKDQVSCPSGVTTSFYPDGANVMVSVSRPQPLGGTCDLGAAEFKSTGPAVATSLRFSAHPSNTAQGVAINPPVKVEVVDQNGNRMTSGTGSTALITILIGFNAGGGSLSGQNQVNASGGEATFSNLSINAIGSGYTLAASTGGGITGVTSNSFNITGPPGVPTFLFMQVHPSTTQAGAIITPAIEVRIADSEGVTVGSSTGQVNLSFAAGGNPGGAALGGITQRNAGNTGIPGVAVFNNITISAPGVGYRLTATTTLPGVGGDTSDPFTVTEAPGLIPVALEFVQHPVDTVAGSVIVPAVSVRVKDSNDQTVNTYTDLVTIAIGSNPAGGTLAGLTALNPTIGFVNYTNLSINTPGNGYTLTATSGGLTPATSVPFSIMPQFPAGLGRPGSTGISMSR